MLGLRGAFAFLALAWTPLRLRALALAPDLGDTHPAVEALLRRQNGGR
jgi:hypothetical protein